MLVNMGNGSWDQSLKKMRATEILDQNNCQRINISNLPIEVNLRHEADRKRTVCYAWPPLPVPIPLVERGESMTSFTASMDPA